MAPTSPIATNPTAWTLGDLLADANLGARAHACGFNPIVTSLCVDSRAVTPGACFIALAGTRHDGHAFIDQAVARGAAAVVVQAGKWEGDCALAVSVPDTHAAVARLGASFHGVAAAQRAGRLSLVGVTGTNGKTTTCALIRAIFDAAGLRTAGFGTIVNDNGGGATASDMTTMAPLDLCRELAAAHARGVTHAVLEVSSHALHQQRCAGLVFDVGVFTNLSRDHLDYHGGMDDYARAKRRLFDALPSTARAVVCADDVHAAVMVERCSARVTRYGIDPAACEARASHIRIDDDRVHFTVTLGERELPLATRLLGRHNVLNATAAAVAADAFGISQEAIQRGIESVACVPGRLELVAGDAPFRVLVDYAHTPDALANVLGITRALTARKIICVFGCGGDRDRGKRPMMARTVAQAADAAVVTSDNPRSEDPHAIIAETVAGFGGDDACAYEVEPDRARAIERAIALAQAGDVVLIAGKGHEKHQVVGGQRLPFDDVDVARRAIARRFGGQPRRVA